MVFTGSDATCGGCLQPIRKEPAGVHSVIGSEVDYEDVTVWVEADSVNHEQLRGVTSFDPGTRLQAAG